MAISKNDAYAGLHNIDGELVKVHYLPADQLEKVFGYQPPGHPMRKRIGWYWRLVAADAVENEKAYHGPFTSSRKAMRDAINKLERKAA